MNKESRHAIDPNSEFIIAWNEVVINNTPEAIWEYAYNPKTWTESNRDEHLGLVFYNRADRPETGTAFYQKETVAGVYSDLRGHILWAERPKLCIWTGVGKYRLFGFIPFEMSVNGVLELKPTKEGTRMSHTLYGRYPDNILGSIYYSIAKKYSEKPGFIPHAMKELLYFKEKLDKQRT